ncbi:uncharacterized protein LJ264_012598 [Porphyrio hochstetteri]
MVRGLPLRWRQPRLAGSVRAARDGPVIRRQPGMAGNLQAAARPGLAAGNDAQHNKGGVGEIALKKIKRERERGEKGEGSGGRGRKLPLARPAGEIPPPTPLPPQPPPCPGAARGAGGERGPTVAEGTRRGREAARLGFYPPFPSAPPPSFCSFFFSPFFYANAGRGLLHIVAKAKSNKKHGERRRERGEEAAAAGGVAWGAGGGWRRTPALRARLIGRENAAPWRRGKARSSLRGLERVHARGQRCRAGRRSTAASPPRPRRASPGPAEPRPPKAAGPQVRACAGGAAPRRAARARHSPPRCSAGGAGGGALFLPGLPLPLPPRTGLGKAPPPLRREGGAPHPPKGVF